MIDWLKNGRMGCGALVIATGLVLTLPAANAQKIICWKDKSGKVVGCGDRVPPEFQQNESRQLDSQGIPRKTNVSAEEAARQKEEAARKAAMKVEEDRKIAEQRRLDSALMNTYTSEKEIDQRRDRELQVVDLQIQQLSVSQKGANEALVAMQKRYESAAKGGKPSPTLIDELARANEEKKRIDARIAEKHKDKEDISKRYAEQKARFAELKGSPAPQPPAAPPAKK